MEARHFLAAFFNYAHNEGDSLNDWDAALNDWQQNDDKWIAAVLNLIEDEARTWALPYLETIAARRTPFSRLYRLFTEAFTKRFAPLDTTEAAQEALKSLKQGKHSMAEYISRFNQYTRQTGWSSADHRTRFYDGLQDQLKDNLAIYDRPTNMYEELRTAVHVLDQCMRQRQAEKHGKSATNTMQAPSKDPNAMEVDASRQSGPKEKHTRKTFVTFMKGKCYRCGSTDHTKANRKHEQDICGHCKKVGHRSPACFNKYMGKSIVAKAAATDSTPSTSQTTAKANATISATSKAPAQSSKEQADLLAKMMAQIEAQKEQIEALKSSF